MKVQRANQNATISYGKLVELIDAMLYTKVIDIKTVANDLKFWAYQAAKELLSLSAYLTEDEIYVLQELVMRCKERAGK